ncbi:tetratricopeptide repeat protein 31 isoform X2 [Octopus sinensis]|uniref:Tetratricopeptide repeat protein 31 isoform X2 n=1 Tax=Octopus sinensis TaxID=2607531 RepID=A0A7E6FCA8_9MOLL|nr:tetratricopeptide repeat protein 31 isoform X2 [Octopus sinensis]
MALTRKEAYNTLELPIGACEKHLTKMKPVQSRNELTEDEEKERRRAEKRRAKKKRQREKKKLEKLEKHPKENGNTSQNKAKDFSDSRKEQKSKNSNKLLVSDTTDDEADFDPSSAFFTNIVNKKKMNLNISEQSQLSNKDRSKDRSILQSHSAKSEDDIEELDTVVLRSRKLAIRGNEMAQMGHYAAAIDLFTEAIRLDPSDFRFFGNRSYCYERIQQYDKALKDAEKSISISSNWPKGFFRKGRALAGQKQYSKAEEAFLQVIQLDINCEDARQELLKVQMHQLTEMGFTKLQAEAAITQYGTVQTALDSLLAGIVADNLNNGLGSEKEFSINNLNHITINSSCSSPMDTKMDPANPEGLTALWVGNVLPEVSEKKLNQLFSRYGPLSSVRCLPDRFCAFINFKTKESAGKAMNSLQGVECGGQKLLIKFPDNPIINVGNVTILKASTSNNSKRYILITDDPFERTLDYHRYHEFIENYGTE